MRFLKIPILFLCGLLLFSGSALALTLGGEEIGELDNLQSMAYVRNSDAAELTWINNELSASYTSTEVIKYDTTDQWAVVDQNPNYFALELIGNPEWFSIKIGIGGTDIQYNHWLYHNEDMLNWAVVNSTEWLPTIVSLQGEPKNNIDSSRISNVTQPVPEPATMLLLGAGIVGLAGIGRKKLFKK